VLGGISVQQVRGPACDLGPDHVVPGIGVACLDPAQQLATADSQAGR
jgi:hypothetical protein